VQLDTPQTKRVAAALLLVTVIWSINGVYLAALARVSTSLFWAADLLQWILVPGLLAVLLAKTAAVQPRHYGLGPAEHRWYAAALASVGVGATTGFAFFWSRNASWELLGQPTGFFSLPTAFPAGSLGTVTWVYSAVTAGLVESAFFIGLPWLLYRSLRLAPSKAIFTVLVSVLFGVCHWEQGPHVVVGAFCSHIVACVWFFALRTLWPVAAGHTMVDLVAFG